MSEKSDGLVKYELSNTHHEKRPFFEMSLFSLFCVVLGNPLRDPFPIDISEINVIDDHHPRVSIEHLSVGHLKILINNKKSLVSDSDDLTLWNVEGLAEGNDKWGILEQIVTKELNNETSTKQKLKEFGAEVLNSSRSVKKIFSDVPKEHVHIIVETSPAATTGKKRLGDSDEGNQAKKKMRQYPAESKEGRDSLLSISGNRLDSIVKFVESNRVSLLRSPPSSGKTTLGQTLRDYFIDRSVYISLAGLGGKDQISEKAFEDFWRNEIGYSWAEINDRIETIYVFIDEIQVIYGNRANHFWSKVKMLMSSECEKDIHILLFGTYDPILMDETTPVKFSDNDTLNLKALLLTKEELKDLLRFYVRMRVLERNTLFKITNEIEDAIFSLTKGHVGLCRFILDSLYTRYKDKSNHFLAEQSEEALTIGMLRYLASPSLSINVMKGSRAFYWIDSWSPTDGEAKFIRNVLLDHSSFPVDYSTDDVAKNFIRTGLFVVDSGQVQFTAPIFRIVLSHHLFTSPLTKEPTPNFEEFLKRTIERMSPFTLTTSYGRGKGSCLLERSWQMEWYRTAKTVAPKNTSVSPDVGELFGANGFLDFFVNSDYCWGIELTREGDRLKEHAERFVNGGKYDRIPMKNWAIIDFRCYKKEVRELKTNFWYVLYANDYKSVTIKRSGQQDEVLILKGDNV